MTYQQVRDILDRVRRLHRRIRDYYQGSADLPHDERARLLLEYMARHEEHVQQCLQSYQDRGADGILDTWIQYVPDGPTHEVFDDFQIRENMSADEAFALALRLDAALLGMYEQLAGMTAAPRAQEFFRSLLALEKSKESEYARSLLATL